MRAVIFSMLVMLPLATTMIDAQEASVGGVYNCGAMPPFVNSLDLKEPLVIDTSIARLPGVVIRELSGDKKMYQKRGWKITGHVGSTVRDSTGAIYAAPSPSISLDTNPLSKRNTVYRINPESGEIEVFIKLPLPKNESQKNPFGVTSLAIDCETSSLYISSVAGSTPQKQAGTIYQVDLKSGDILSQINGIDALGIAVFKTRGGKRLYYGEARSSSLNSLALNKSGAFTLAQSPRYLLSLLAIKNGDSTQIRKIRFDQNPERGLVMILDETEFSYRMATESGRQYRKYRFLYDVSRDEWRHLSISAR